ncbi:MAG: signal transduction histidine kinase/ligand-binding sensor domain-containing protein, partial [Candidatus Latescibacterota bacterium]
HPPVRSLCASRDGSVYVGTEGGISRFRDGKWEKLLPDEKNQRWFVHSLIEARDGSIWAATYWGALRITPNHMWLYTTAPFMQAIGKLPDGMTPIIVPFSYDRALPNYTGAWEHYNRILAVTKGSAADQAGLKPGDRILKTDPIIWRAGLSVPLPGTKVRVSVEREGVKDLVDLVLETQLVQGSFWDFKIHDVFEDRDGHIWLARWDTELFRFDPQDDGFDTWQRFTAPDGKRFSERPRLGQTHDGMIWAISDEIRSDIYRFDGQNWEALNRPDIHTSIMVSKDGTLWIGGSGDIYTYRNGKWMRYDKEHFPISRWKRTTDFLEASDGGIWLARSGNAPARIDYASSQWTSYVDLIFQAYESDGTEWFLSVGEGVVRFDGENWIRYDERDGLVAIPQAILVTREGKIWVAGSHDNKAALSCFDGQRWTRQVYPELSWGVSYKTFFEAQDGALWLGSAFWYDSDLFDPETGALKGWGFRGGVLRVDPSQEKDPGVLYSYPDVYWEPYGVGQSPEGHIWTGGITLNRFNGTYWSRVIDPLEFASTAINMVYTDQKQNLWLSTRTQGVMHYNGEFWSRYGTNMGVPSNEVRDVTQTTDGAMWASTYRGFARFDGNRWMPTLPNCKAGDLEQGSKGELWINQAGMATHLDYRYNPIKKHTVGVLDIKATRYVPEQMPPETRITVALDRVSQPGNTVVRWEGYDPWHGRENVMYSYRMNGGDWTPFTPETHATFFELGSGDHIFEVRARDMDFNVDPTPAVLTFLVVPPVWQQPWFIGLMGVLLMMIGVQTGRVVRRGRSLQTSNRALQEEIETREKLDTQLQDLRYLYLLRTELGDARSEEDIAQVVGKTMMDVFSASQSSSVHVKINGDAWSFGSLKETHQYSRPLSWGERERGQLEVYCAVALSEGQEGALLDETAGQLVRVLEARELEGQLLQSARLVSMGQMAAGVAHELNQPLAAISATAGDVQLRLIEGVPMSEADLKEMMADVVNWSQRLGETVDHLRIFSRDTADEEGILFSMNDVVHSGLRLIGTQLENHGIVLSLDLGDDLPEVEGHPHQMEQVFLNLLGNARDAMDEIGGDKRVSVQTRREDDSVVFEVSDRGVGISDEDLNRIFEPFFTTKDAEHGTGLGLSISYAIVKNHGGDLTCRSVLGNGSVFSVNIPIHKI